MWKILLLSCCFLLFGAYAEKKTAKIKELRKNISQIDRLIWKQEESKLPSVKDVYQKRQLLMKEKSFESGPTRPLDPVLGEKKYQEHCQGCHGALGKGDGPLASRLPQKLKDLTSGLFQTGTSPSMIYHVLTQETQPMPNYSAILTNDELWAVSFYWKSLPFQTQSSSAEWDAPYTLSQCADLPDEMIPSDQIVWVRTKGCFLSRLKK